MRSGKSKPLLMQLLVFLSHLIFYTFTNNWLHWQLSNGTRAQSSSEGNVTQRSNLSHRVMTHHLLDTLKSSNGKSFWLGLSMVQLNVTMCTFALTEFASDSSLKNIQYNIHQRLGNSCLPPASVIHYFKALAWTACPGTSLLDVKADLTGNIWHNQSAY